ncbi:MAG: hypothetical protein RBS80_12115 [Thermoguttaceae bacterium]|jgi:hypothetical protein|nr:hypothetical protein [Thermoguttaceae bacterium]
MQHHLLSRLAALALPVVLAGCGSAEPYDTVSVSGTIHYVDGSRIPASRITLFFVPQVPAVDAKTHPRNATAEVNVEDGTFSNASTFSFGDGVIPGTQKVLVRAYSENDEPSPAVPQKYGDSDTSPLEVQIEGKTKSLVLEIEKP